MPASTRKLALVTGTTSGVGSAVATLLLERDWEVIGVARRAATHSHRRYRHIRLDLSGLAEVRHVFERDVAPLLSASDLSRVALVNNAASAAMLGPIESLDPTELARLHAVNLTAPMWCMGFVSRHTPKQVPLRIVNVSSGAAMHAFAGLGAYSSAKAGLRMAGMILAAEWESTVPHAPTRTNAAVLSYEPSNVDTPMQEAARSHAPEEFPWVSMFTGMRDRGALVPAEAPAAEIVAFLDSASAPAFSERRLGQ
ncbi:MAG: SDR family NAD(P)-dependent oxidoreductase [Gemmatimonadaceae bacterium]